ncbi:MAG: amidase [Nitriliruptorales bacterium]
MAAEARTRSWAGTPAADIAAAVRAGDVDPVTVLDDHLAAVGALDSDLRAFQALAANEARVEARRLANSGDLSDRTLAGVPVAVKDDVDVAGLPTRKGSQATTATAYAEDDEMVRRLRQAGALVLGKTRVPEFTIWPFTETLGFGSTRNPWDLTRTPGGSSGGSAAAVAAGMVPLAIGSDGLGSIRIPGSCCGLFGIKPGPDLVPRPRRAGIAWFDMTEHGPLATTVVDAALMLAVMSARPDLGEVRPPEPGLRVAVSTANPAAGFPVHPTVRAATHRVAAALHDDHTVASGTPPYPLDLMWPLVQRWVAGVAASAEGLPEELLEPRTRTHVRLGRLVQRTAPVREADAERWTDAALEWFEDHDVLLTPALAQLPLRVGTTARNGWLLSALRSTWFAPFAAPWNLCGFPAAVVPAGRTRTGLPVGVQLVAPPGGERLLLSVAALVERRLPWPRLATHAGVAGQWTDDGGRTATRRIPAIR